MLVAFEVEGVYSFGKRVRVGFGAGLNSRLKNTKYEDNFCLDDKAKVMKSAVFFGANATGKTNLFLAMKMLKDILNYGLEYSLSKKKNHFYYGSDKAFLAVELSDEKSNLYRYEIGFDTQGKVLEESLLKNQKSVFVYKDRLLQSALLQNGDFEQFQAIFPHSEVKESVFKLLMNFLKQDEFLGFVVEVLKIRLHSKISYSKGEDTACSKEIKEYFETHKMRVIDLLGVIDASIDDFYFREIQEEEGVRYKIILKRGKIDFDYQQESEGVKKILRLTSQILQVIENNAILIVDELDSSISTLALIELLNSFINTADNKRGQLIITSHNLLLFDVSFLNSQQIFLVQKDRELCTRIRSYYEFDIRSEKKQAYLSYLRGAYDED